MNHILPDDAPLQLASDDPRISEWIDGRLAGHEAEAVARAVAASAELTRFVAELRAVKEAVAGVPAAQPPRDFVRSVMDAIGTAAVDGGEDAVVEAEWRKLEAERIEEERDEARDDAVETTKAPTAPRWPWAALALSLAAGVFVAAFLNTAIVRRREVAMETPPPAPLARAMRPAASPPAERLSKQDLPQADGPMALAQAPAPVHREIAIVIDGPRGRETLSRLLAEAGITGQSTDDETSGGEGVRDAGATLADNRLEMTAPATAIDAFLAAIDRATGEGVSLERAETGEAELRTADATDAVMHLVVRIIETAEPAPAAAADAVPRDAVPRDAVPREEEE